MPSPRSLLYLLRVHQNEEADRERPEKEAYAPLEEEYRRLVSKAAERAGLRKATLDVDATIVWSERTRRSSRIVLPAGRIQERRAISF